VVPRKDGLYHPAFVVLNHGMIKNKTKMVQKKKRRSPGKMLKSKV